MDTRPPIFTVETPDPVGRPPRRGTGGYGGTFASMLISMVVLAWYIGNWQVAVGVVVLIFVHEMGHVIAAFGLGIPVTAPIFIPFLGAAIVMRENPRGAVVEALMAYGGPLAGAGGSWICLTAAQSTGHPWLLLTAMYSFQLNLFNLIPVPPLDGGRICAAVSRWFWAPGLLLIVLAMVLGHAWQLLFMGSLILMSAFQRIQTDLHHSDEMRSYYRVGLLKRTMIALCYVGLIGGLVVGWMEADALVNAMGI